MTAPEFDLARWADQVKLDLQPVSGDDLIKLTDQEFGIYLSRWQGSFLVETTGRGEHRSRLGEFSDEDDARRFLVLRQSRTMRSEHGRARVEVPGPAPDVDVETGPTTLRLRWSGARTAEFADTLVNRIVATEFSWVVSADLAEIVQSYRSEDGAPLFAVA